MVESLKSFAEGEVDRNLRYRVSYSDKVIQGLVGKIEARMQYSLNFDQRRKLKSVVAKIEEDAHQAIKAARSATPFDTSGYWDYLTHASEFQFCILGIQRINYGSLFFAYEDFLANVIRTKEPTYSSKKTPIKDAFTTQFGDQLANYCWNHEEVDLARLVRNALAHNGGRFGKDLRKYQPRFTDVTGISAPPIQGELFNLEDGKIQITPDNTKYLFGVLKECVSEIVKCLA